MEPTEQNKIVKMAARGEITKQEAKERFKEIGQTFQKKMTKEAILDMMETGYLTMEESEVELKELEARH